MNKLLLVAAAVAVGVGNAFGSTTTYRIVDYPTDENGFSQSAAATPQLPYSYIVTDGTIGQLSPSDVLSGDWAYRNPNAAAGQVEVVASGISGNLTYFNDFVATPTELLLPSGGSLAFGNTNDILDYNNTSGSASFSCYASNSLYAWNTPDPTMNGAEPWVVAVLVPEPTTLILASVSAGAVWFWRRRQHGSERQRG